MKYAKLFEDYYEDHVDRICRKYYIKSYTINQDGSIDIDGPVFLDQKKLQEIPIQFNKVSRDFYIYENKLTSLKYSPRYVGGDFSFNENKIMTLEYAPKKVGEEFSGIDNHLISLYNFPDVGGHIYLSKNPVYEIVNVVSNHLFKDIELKTFIKYLNQYDVIRTGMIVDDLRLDTAYNLVTGKNFPEEIENKFIFYRLV